MAVTQASLYAFEPIPSVFQQLQLTVADAPLAAAFPVALADHNGELDLCFDQANTGNITALADVQGSVHGLRSVECIRVRAQRLDDFCSEHSIQSLDLLKIDVEGFEFAVFEGVRR